MDTIAAISTAPAVSAIGVLRVSGPEALRAAEGVFRPADGRPLSEHRRREMVYGSLRDREGRMIDRALAVVFSAGHSYTGEESVEFHCHGSPVVLQEGLEALFAQGARQAAGGEFTKRAFLNGKLDLTQAEAVADLIEAETAEAARNAAGQVDGALRRRVSPIYEGLLEALSRFYAVVDYPDEDIGDLTREALERTLTEAGDGLRDLLSTVRRGRVLRRGVATAIVGAPNVGKSSLLNALAGYDRAIVADTAGTTRDTVEEKARCGGVLLRLTDTAGIRDTEDAVERLGVERSRAAMAGAELILMVLDQSRPIGAEELALARQAAALAPTILVLNKSDLPAALELEEAPAAAVRLSAKTGAGLPELEALVAKLFPPGTAPAGQVLTNARQAEAAERALRGVEGALEALRNGLTPDAALTDAEAAVSALGELTGRTLREDLVARIFSRFCVGK